MSARRTGAPLARPPQEAEPVEQLRVYVRAIATTARAAKDADVAREEAHRRRNLRIVGGLKAGLTLAQAAQAAGMSKSNVRVVARAAGLALPQGPRPRRRSEPTP